MFLTRPIRTLSRPRPLPGKVLLEPFSQRRVYPGWPAIERRDGSPTIEANSMETCTIPAKKLGSPSHVTFSFSSPCVCLLERLQQLKLDLPDQVRFRRLIRKLSQRITGHRDECLLSRRQRVHSYLRDPARLYILCDGADRFSTKPFRCRNSCAADDEAEDDGGINNFRN